MKINITKLEYDKDSVPPFTVTFNDSRLMFPPEALPNRIGVHDLENEIAAVEHLIKEMVQRESSENTFEFEWASGVDTALLTKYLPVQPKSAQIEEDFSYLYSR